MTLIQINTEEVTKTGNDFNSMHGEVMNLVNRANSMMSSLEAQFKGQRATKIFGEWQEMRPRLESSIQSLEMAGSLLNRAATDFSQVDIA